jgi:hypothetical protein
MNTIKRCLTTVVLAAAALTQTGCPTPNRQLDQTQELRDYETYHRADTFNKQPDYMPPPRNYKR